MDRSPILRALAAAAVAAYVFDVLYMRPQGYAGIGRWIDERTAGIRPDAGAVSSVIARATAITREASEEKS